MSHTVKNLLAIWETRVQSLGWEDPLEKEMATHFSILVWKISWTEGPGGLQWGWKGLDMTESLTVSFLSYDHGGRLRLKLL